MVACVTTDPFVSILIAVAISLLPSLQHFHQNYIRQVVFFRIQMRAQFILLLSGNEDRFRFASLNAALSSQALTILIASHVYHLSFHIIHYNSLLEPED